MTTVSFAEALNAALMDSMGEDHDVVVLGEDVGKLGGVFRITDGLADKFGPQRCMDTPLAESGIVGVALGMALYGRRPVVELQFDGFTYPAFEQIISHVAKYRNRSRGTVELPLTLRVPYGGGIGGAEHHGESPEAYFAHTAGLKVFTPGAPADAYALLREAIALDDPVVFLEPKRRYWSKQEVSLPRTAEPAGTAAIRRPGRDLTLVTYGSMLLVALEAAELAAAEGWDLEVLDLRTLVPLDEEGLLRSVARTGRCITLSEAPPTAAFTADISAFVSEHAWDYLRGPVLRVGAFDVPYPPSRIEQHYLPDAARVLDAVAVSMKGVTA